MTDRSIWDSSKVDNLINNWIVISTIVFVASCGCIEVLDARSPEKQGITPIEKGAQAVDKKGERKRQTKQRRQRQLEQLIQRAGRHR